jgi:iron complex transport system substrate-binding protein
MTGRCLVAVLLLLTACRGEESNSATTTAGDDGPTDAIARRVELTDYVRDPVVDPEDPPTELRLLPLAPSATEILCALGLSENLVGRTQYCQYPPRIQSLPVVGALTDLNLEVVTRLEPDLVLVAGSSRAQTARLSRIGLSFATLPDETLPDLFKAIEQAGALTSRPRTAATLVTNLRQDLERVDAAYNIPPQRVLLLIGTLATPPAPPFIAGPESFYTTLIERAGCTNAAPEGFDAFAPLSLEVILREDPDVIIELDADGSARPHGSADARAAWERVGDLTAVREGRVHVLSGRRHFLLSPRITFTYADLCHVLAGASDG